MNIKDKNKIRSFNIDTLKLLIAQEDVQNKIRDIRSAAKDMPNGGFQNKEEFTEWYLPILDKYVKGDKETLVIMGALYDGINKIINTHGLTKDFFPPLWSYVGFNELELRVSGNIEISMTYPEKNEPLVITLEVFRKPSVKELDEIKNTIKEWSSVHLPSHRKIKTGIKKDIDNDLRAWSLMKMRGVHKEKIYDSQYLDAVKKKYEMGQISEKKLQEAEKKNKGAIRIKKHKITSRTIAKNLFGRSGTAPRVRAINKRIKEEIKKRFKKV